MKDTWRLEQRKALEETILYWYDIYIIYTNTQVYYRKKLIPIKRLPHARNYVKHFYILTY